MPHPHVPQNACEDEQDVGVKVSIGTRRRIQERYYTELLRVTAPSPYSRPACGVVRLQQILALGDDYTRWRRHTEDVHGGSPASARTALAVTQCVEGDSAVHRELNASAVTRPGLTYAHSSLKNGGKYR